MHFNEKYYRNLKYSQKEHLIRKHILDVLRWGSKVGETDLLDGKGKTALDVGCAYGYGIDVLESFGYDAYGVDISEHSIRIAKKSHEADFVVCDVQKEVPFRKAVFDLVTCYGVLEHLLHPLQALKSMFAVCRETMICTTPNRIVEKPVKKVIGDYDETHVNVKTQKEWEEHISENLNCSFFKIEPFLDASIRVANELLFFRPFKMPYFGLDLRILIKK